jgi:putative transposase
MNSKWPFEIIAWVVLPNHFHLLIDPVDNNVSTLMKRVKLSFSTCYRKRVGARSGRVWQYRFWDHIIRDQSDLNRHVDYVHYNPVKHGFTKSPFGWEYSSIHEYCKQGYYPDDCGIKEPLKFEGTFGE